MAAIIAIVRVILGIYVGLSIACFVYCFKHSELKFTTDEVVKAIRSTFIAALLLLFACLL